MSLKAFENYVNTKSELKEELFKVLNKDPSWVLKDGLNSLDEYEFYGQWYNEYYGLWKGTVHTKYGHIQVCIVENPDSDYEVTVI